MGFYRGLGGDLNGYLIFNLFLSEEIEEESKKLKWDLGNVMGFGILGMYVCIFFRMWVCMGGRVRKREGERKGFDLIRV